MKVCKEMSQDWDGNDRMSRNASGRQTGNTDRVRSLSGGKKDSGLSRMGIKVHSC